MKHTRTGLAAALLSSLAVCHGDCGGATSTDAQAPTPSFTGRFARDPNNAQAQIFAWSQSTISARFIGTQVAVRLQDIVPNSGPGDSSNHYDVIIDDHPAWVLPMRAEQSTYALAHDLLQGAHTVTLIKRTEASVGSARFSGFDFGPDGHMLLPPKHPDRRLLIIGDSISAGYGNEGPNEKCPFTPATENSALAYGSVAANALGADVHIIAWSGKGVYRNRDETRHNLMPQLQERVLPTDANSLWNPNDYQPHAVVVNLGTNDFGHDLAPEQPFEDAYYDFIITLRKAYPEAYITMALGPMLEDTEKNHHQLTVARNMLQTVASRLHQAHMSQIGFLEFPPQRADQGFGCDYHPNIATHAKMGAQLAAILKATLKWN